MVTSATKIRAPGHGLVADVYVAAEGEEDSPQGEQQYTQQHAPQYHAYEETGR